MKTLRFFALACALSVAAGCGKKGDLTLPSARAAATPAAVTAPPA